MPGSTHPSVVRCWRLCLILSLVLTSLSPFLPITSASSTALTSSPINPAPATISLPPEASFLPPGRLVVSGTVSVDAVAVEVRLRGETDWLPATLTGTAWEIELELPEEFRPWWIEARARCWSWLVGSVMIAKLLLARFLWVACHQYQEHRACCPDYTMPCRVSTCRPITSFSSRHSGKKTVL